MEACLPSSLQQNANDVCNKKALAKWNCSLHFHIASASPFLQRTHSQSEMWNRIPVCREFNVQIPSRHQTNGQKKQARCGRSCAGDEKGQGRAGASGLCGAPVSHRGAWTDLGTTEPWPVRGPGTRAALKWLPASRLPEEGCSKPRAGCPPRLPCCQGASASLAAGETRPRCPAFGAPPKAKGRRPAPAFNSAEGHPSTARLCAARAARHRHGNLFSPPLSHYWTAETQSVSQLVTAQVKAALRGLSFLTILCATDCFLQLEKPTRAFQTFSPPLLGQTCHCIWSFFSKEMEQNYLGQESTSTPISWR